MQYQGGKSRFVHPIVQLIRDRHPTEEALYEPFCGGWSMTLGFIRAGFYVYASDAHPDLVLLGEAIRTASDEELDIILGPVSEQTYRDLRCGPSSARRGFVGFGSSFGGSFFGGFGRNSVVELWKPARNFCLKLRAVRHRFEIRRADYRDTPGGLVYADPPYVGTKSYLPDGTPYRRGPFDHQAFWDWVTKRPNPTYVSEKTPPGLAGIEPLWEEVGRVKNNSPNKPSKQTEALELLLYWRGVRPGGSGWPDR